MLDPLAGPEIVAMAPTPRLAILSAYETGQRELVGSEGLL